MVLELTSVQKNYASVDGDVQVLAGVDLSINRGETHALTGESGSGKSTLLHLAAGLDLPDAGEVMVAGQPMSKLDDAGRAGLRRRDVAVVFQQFNLIPTLSVQDNIAFQARLAGVFEPTAVASLSHALGLEEHLDKYPEQLSGGQQQRVAIARALAVKPQLILADEPTGNLDEETADRVLDEMLRLVSEARTTLLLVTHSPKVAARMGRTWHLERGHLS
ncbi:MAG: ABC transporter ATP-binding protein [Marinovum sp.]|nr:ABC transporter ATP-binding protein [Marinovum sp.]